MKGKTSLDGDESGTILIIQYIRTCWTKRSRGGHWAQVRGRVPECLPISLTGSHGTALSTVVHHVTYTEATKFGSPRQELAINAGEIPTFGCARVGRSHSEAWVEYA